jgi:hypothetical protein
MGNRGSKDLNQSHYDDAVKYTTFKLVQGQSHLLPQLRSSSLTIRSGYDVFRSSSTNASDIPAGWQVKQAKIK